MASNLRLSQNNTFGPVSANRKLRYGELVWLVPVRGKSAEEPQHYYRARMGLDWLAELCRSPMTPE